MTWLWSRVGLACVRVAFGLVALLIGCGSSETGATDRLDTPRDALLFNPPMKESFRVQPIVRAGPSMVESAALKLHAGRSGRDAPDAAVCEPGRADCDGVAANGCETSVADDPDNCGACGSECVSGACVAGTCVPPVPGSFAAISLAYARGDLAIDLDGDGVPDWFREPMDASGVSPREYIDRDHDGRPEWVRLSTSTSWSESTDLDQDGVFEETIEQHLDGDSVVVTRVFDSSGDGRPDRKVVTTYPPPPAELALVLELYDMDRRGEFVLVAQYEVPAYEPSIYAAPVTVPSGCAGSSSDELKAEYEAAVNRGWECLNDLASSPHSDEFDELRDRYVRRLTQVGGVTLVCGYLQEGVGRTRPTPAGHEITVTPELVRGAYDDTASLAEVIFHETLHLAGGSIDDLYGEGGADYDHNSSSLSEGTDQVYACDRLCYQEADSANVPCDRIRCAGCPEGKKANLATCSCECPPGKIDQGDRCVDAYPSPVVQCSFPMARNRNAPGWRGATRMRSQRSRLWVPEIMAARIPDKGQCGLSAP